MADNHIQSNETGVVLPYEKTAIFGGDMPDNLSGTDQWMFLCLRNLYGQIRLGIIDRATGIKEKRNLLDQYTSRKFQDEVMEKMIYRFKSGEAVASEYRTNPTIDNADKVMEALYGVKRKV